MLYIFSPTSEQLQQYLLTTKIDPKPFYSCVTINKNFQNRTSTHIFHRYRPTVYEYN